MARVYADVPLDAVQVTDTYVRVGYADVPIVQSGEALINWPTSDLNVAFPTYSALDVLRGDVGRNELAGKAILVGMTAAGLDDRPVSVRNDAPGRDSPRGVPRQLLHAQFPQNRRVGGLASSGERSWDSPSWLSSFLACRRRPFSLWHPSLMLARCWGCRSISSS